MNEVQLTWFDLASKTIELLQKYDNEHNTYYAYYLNEEREAGRKVLAECLQAADKTFLWKGVPHA